MYLLVKIKLIITKHFSAYLFGRLKRMYTKISLGGTTAGQKHEVSKKQT